MNTLFIVFLPDSKLLPSNTIGFSRSLFEARELATGDYNINKVMRINPPHNYKIMYSEVPDGISDSAVFDFAMSHIEDDICIVEEYDARPPIVSPEEDAIRLHEGGWRVKDREDLKQTYDLRNDDLSKIVDFMIKLETAENAEEHKTLNLIMKILCALLAAGLILLAIVEFAM